MRQDRTATFIKGAAAGGFVLARASGPAPVSRAQPMPRPMAIQPPGAFRRAAWRPAAA